MALRGLRPMMGRAFCSGSFHRPHGSEARFFAIALQEYDLNHFLERLEVMWLLGRLIPDDKVIADFRKDNGPAIRKVYARFVELCRKMGLLTKASVAIDGSKPRC